MVILGGLLGVKYHRGTDETPVGSVMEIEIRYVNGDVSKNTFPEDGARMIASVTINGHVVTDESGALDPELFAAPKFSPDVLLEHVLTDIRARKSLNAAGLITIGDITKVSPGELSRIDGIGTGAVTTVKRMLKEIGLTLDLTRP